MQSGKSFEAKWARLQEAVGGKTDTAIARVLEILPQSVTASRKRKQIPGGWVEKIAESRNINANWLFFGAGQKELVNNDAANTATPRAPDEKYHELERRILILEARLEEKQALIDRLLELHK